MGEERVYICVNCKEWYLVPEKNVAPKCPECGKALNFVNIDYGKFNNLTEEERDDLRYRYIMCYDNVPNTRQSAYKQSGEIISSSAASPGSTYDNKEKTDKGNRRQQTNKKKKDSSAWISLLKILCIVVVAIFMMVGVFFMAPLLLKEHFQDRIIGILIFIGLTLIGFLVVSGTMVFLGIARDLKAIRNELERRS